LERRQQEVPEPEEEDNHLVEPANVNAINTYSFLIFHDHSVGQQKKMVEGFPTFIANCD
jgi:hypothetical protein